MEERYFIWDEISDGVLLVSSTQKPEDEHVKKIKTTTDTTQESAVYAPHAYLMLNFNETLSQREKLRFRKYYLRKVSPNKPDVIILQDIKDLILFLLISPISPQFVNFFHLPVVDRFLRAIILYFQFYVMTWEELMAERAATMKKAPNPLAQGYRFRYAEEMLSLRCILGREYADLIIGCQDTVQYHHMTGGKKEGSVTQSQGEKDLRMFEVLLCLAHRIVWVALQRKHFSLIEIELHRLFRTEAYNIAERRSIAHVVQDMLDDDIRVLQGQKMQEKRKLLRNSPLVQDLIYSDCDHRLLALGMDAKPDDDERIRYLQCALVAEEDKLESLGVKVGILGESRANYDVMLMPIEEKDEQDPSKLSMQLSEKKMFDKKSTITEDTQAPEKIARFPPAETRPDFTKDFSMKTIDLAPRGYEIAREEARKKWFIREMKRRGRKQVDTYSISTVLE